MDAAHLSAEPPRAVRLPLTLALSVARRSSRRAVTEGSAEVAALRSVALRARLLWTSGGGPIVQVGTGYAVPPGRPVVTLEDMTIRQAIALGIPEWRAQPEHCVRARVRLQRASYGRAVGCCVASDWAAGSVVSDYGISSEKVHVVGLGRNHDPRPVPRDWTTPRFLFVGQDWSRKGGPELLRAFAQLRERVPGATLDVVGGHPRLDADGARGRGNRLSAPGTREHIQGLFETATCCVMPSRFEPFGIVHVEAAAAGVPSIGTTVGGAGYAEIGPEAGRSGATRRRTGAPRHDARASEPRTPRCAWARRSGTLAPVHWRAVAERVLAALQTWPRRTAGGRQKPGPAPPR